jgi:NAD(P)-dependent dehydrogenase (short-subunit alcohol dehydrogenase family)
MSDFQGTILVQGASRGIGLAMAEHLLEHAGVERVIATSREPESSEALTDLRARSDGRLVLVPMDVTDNASIARAAEVVQDHTDSLEGVINTAGILHDTEQDLGPEKRVEQLDAAALDTGFRVNAFGPMLVGKHLFKLLRHKRPAFFASLSARVGSIEDNQMGGWYSYRAAKAAQNQFTRTFAVEAARRARNLRVLALHPGTTDTDLSAPFQRNVPDGKLFSTGFVAERLLGVIANTDASDSGSFLDWDHQSIPW